MNQLRFQEACDRVIDNVREENGIGTLGEKTIHAVLKHYYAPDVSHHEQRMLGFVADIFNGEEIIEIQTRNFNALRRKLDAFLPEHDVMVVYPIPHIKWLRWINPESGEVSSKRKSPKIGTHYQVFHELYRIKQYLPNPRLHFCFALLDVEEYRLLNGYGKDKKKGSSRNDGIPVAFAEEVMIDSPKDYMCFLPIDLPDEFTVSDYQKATKLPKSEAGTALHILNYIGTIEQIGKRGRSYLYKVRKC